MAADGSLKESEELKQLNQVRFSSASFTGNSN